MAQRAEVSVYTISTNPTGSGGHGNKTLERIAEATGGRSYEPSQITEVANAFTAIQEELRSQYTIGYVPTNKARDGAYRKIKVEMKNKDYSALARRGYYAPNN